MYAYKFRPSYMINNVVENSPADLVGLLKGDIIVKINGKLAHTYTLEDIFYKLQERDKKKLKITVERSGEKIKFEFRLKQEV